MEFNNNFSSLSPRQKEVLEQFILGKTDQEIAENFNIVPGTVRKHFGKIYEKLGIETIHPGQEKRSNLKDIVAQHQPELIPNNKVTVLDSENKSNESTNIINWREILNPENLNDYLKLRQNATEKDFELDIYVPLGLIERKEQQRRPLNQDLEVNQVYQLPEKEEITRKFEHQEFLDHIGLREI